MNKKKLVILISIIITLAILVCAGIFAVSKNRAGEIEDKLDLGEKYLEELEYEKALAVYKEILEIDPKNVDAYLGMAEVYVAMGEYEEAMKILEEGYRETGDAKLAAKKTEVEALPGVATNKGIDWMDEGLEFDMRQVTGIYDREITHEDVEGIVELDLSYGTIRDIRALSIMTNLEVLILSHNEISDISVLSNMPNLKRLDLTGNQIDDISVLSTLTNLERLDLGRNQISNIDALSNLTNLEILQLFENPIEDISALSNLINLRILWLQYTEITSVDALSGLSNLEVLYLDGNSIRDYSPIYFVPTWSR